MWPFGFGIVNKYPYSDFHELNTDFLIQKCAEIAQNLKDSITARQGAETAQAAAEAAQKASETAQAAAETAQAGAETAQAGAETAENNTRKYYNNLATHIAGDVGDWLRNNVNPVGSAVVVDSSLTISGAAADAKVTGDKISDVSESLYNQIFTKEIEKTASGGTDRYFYPCTFVKDRHYVARIEINSLQKKSDEQYTFQLKTSPTRVTGSEIDNIYSKKGDVSSTVIYFKATNNATYAEVTFRAVESSSVDVTITIEESTMESYISENQTVTLTPSFEIGTIKNNSGVDNDSTTRIRSIGFLDLNDQNIIAYCDDGYKIGSRLYDETNAFIQGSSSFFAKYFQLDNSVYQNAKYARIVAAYDDDAEISAVSDVSSHVHILRTCTDSTMTMRGVPADAYYVGDRLSKIEKTKDRTGDFEFFTVNVDRPLSFGGEEQKTSTDTVECVLRLPTSYERTGKPTRLVLACHGAGGYIQASTSTWYNSNWKTFMDALLEAGYAVFDANVLPTSYGTSVIGAANGSPLYINVLKTAYDYIIENYNVYPQIFAHGTSMGGTGASAFVKSYPSIVLAQSSFAGRDFTQYIQSVKDGTLNSPNDFAVAYGYADFAALTSDKFSHANGVSPSLTLHKYNNGVMEYPPDRVTDYQNWLTYYGEIQSHEKNDTIGQYVACRNVPYKSWNSWADDEAKTKAEMILQKAYTAGGSCPYECVVYDSGTHTQMSYGQINDMIPQLLAWYKRWE